MWYLLITQKFKILFANVNDANNTRCHAYERVCNGEIRNVANSLQWKKVNSLFPYFVLEPRNLILGLTTDDIDVDDAYADDKFKMRVMLFCTINDFPAYTIICLGTTLRDIKHVIYVKMIHSPTK